MGAYTWTDFKVDEVEETNVKKAPQKRQQKLKKRKRQLIQILRLKHYASQDV
jgi:hypothetical protein